MKPTLRILAGAVLLVAGLAPNAAAQDPAVPSPSASAYVDPIDGLSLSDVIQRGLEREPDLLAVRAGVDVARGERQQAGLRPNPAASVVGQRQWRGTDTLGGAEVSLPLDLFRRAGRVATADRAIDVAEATLADRRRTLAADITSAYGDLLVAIRRVEVTDERIATLQRTFDLLRARVAEGASPALERNMAAVELQRAQAERFTGEARVEGAIVELKRLAGAGRGEDLKIRDTLESALATLTTSTGLGMRSTQVTRPA